MRFKFWYACSLLAYSTVLFSCFSDFPHKAPYDAKTPADQRKKATLVGRIELENENDAASVDVQLVDKSRSYSVASHADGTITLPGIVPGRYTLSVNTRYFEQQTAIIDFATGEEKDLGTLKLAAKRAPVTGSAAVADKKGALSGGVQVKLQRTGSARGAGAAPGLFALAAADVTDGPTFSVNSDVDGNFTFNDVPSGVYDLSTVLPGIALGEKQKVTVTGEDGTVTVEDVVLFPMFGNLKIAGQNAAGEVSSTTLNLELDATGSPQAVQIAFDPYFDTALPTFTMGPVTSVTLAPGDGVRTVYARYFDANGNISTVAQASVVVDTAPPTLAGVKVNQGAAVTASPVVSLQLEAVDAGTGVAAYKVSETNSFDLIAAKPFQLTDTFSLSGADGPTSVWVVFADNVGNYSVPVKTDIFLDTTPPAVASFSLQKLDGTAVANNAYVNETSLLLLSSVTDVGNLEMQVTTNGSYAGEPWVPYVGVKVIELTTASLVLSARVRDGAGHVVNLINAISVNLDVVPPVGSVARTSAALTNNAIVGLSLSANENSWAQVSEDPSFAGASWFTTQNTSVTLPPGDGLRTLFVRFKDMAGNVSEYKTAFMTLDQTAPVVRSEVIAEAPVTATRVLSLALDTVNADGMQLSESAVFSGASWVPYFPAPTFTLAAGSDGARNVYTRYRDNAGNVTPGVAHPVTLDTTPPAAVAFEVNAGAPYTTQRLVNLTLGASVDAVLMQVSESPSFVGANSDAFATDRSFTLSPTESYKILYARLRDAVGNYSAPFTTSITYDGTPPQSPSISIATPVRGYASQVTVPLSLSASGASDMILSVSGAFTDATYQPYNAAVNFTLRNVQGAQTVYAKFKDLAGNESPVVAESVILDTVKPVISRLQLDEGAFANDPTVHLTLFANGADTMKISESSGMVTVSSIPFATVSAFAVAPVDGLKTIYVEAQDQAGNKSSLQSLTFTLDRQPPAVFGGSLRINGGATYATSNIVSLSIAVTGATEMILSNTNFINYQTWEPVTTSTTWLLDGIDDPAAVDVHTVFAVFRDAAGNEAGPVPASIILDTHAPQNPAASSQTGAYTNNALVQLYWKPSLAPAASVFELFADNGFGYQGPVSTFATGVQSAVIPGWKYSDAFALRTQFAGGAVSSLSNAAADAGTSVKTKYILVVDQDGGTNDTQNVLVKQLDALGYAGLYDTQTHPGSYGAGPALAQMNDYQVVVWNAPYAAPNYDDLLNLGEYTDGGGNLFLISPELPWAWGNANLTFVREGLRVAAPVDGGQAAALAGVPGDAISGGLAFEPQRMTYAGVQAFELDADNAAPTFAEGGRIYGMHAPAAGAARSRIVLQTVPLESLEYANQTSSFVEVPYVWQPAPINTGIGWDYEASMAYDYLSFQFPFFGNLYSNLYYNANGSASFDYENYIGWWSYYETMPSPNYPNGLIAPWRRDLNIAFGGNISIASSPSIYTISYNGVANSGNLAPQSFQMSLFPTGDIEFSYANVSADEPTVAGIEDASGQRGTPLPIVAYSNQTFRYSIPKSPDLSTYLQRTVRWMSAPDDVTKSAIPYVSLDVDAAGATEVQVSTDGNFDSELWVAYTGSLANVSLPAGDGTKTVYVRFRDAAGNVSQTVTVNSTLDVAAPFNAKVVINAGAAYTNTLEGRVNLTLGAVDAVSGLKNMALSNTGTFSAPPLAYNTIVSNYPLDTSAEGVHYVWVRFSDNAGNFSAPVSSSIIVDKTAPSSVTVSVAYGAVRTNASVVNLTLGATDNYGVTEMLISSSPSFSDAAWQPFTTSTSWVLPPGDGLKQVFAKVRDAAGNASVSRFDSVTLDQSPPLTPVVSIDQGNLTNDTIGVLAWDQVEQPGVTGYQVVRCTGWCGAPSAVSTYSLPKEAYYWEPPTPIDDFTYEYYVTTLYADGTSSAPSQPAYFPWGQQLINKIDLIVIDDDEDTVENDLLLEDLQALGYTFDLWTVPAGADGPDWNVLKNYATIIWSSGTAPAPINPNDEYTLMNLWDDRSLILITPGYYNQATWFGWLKDQLLFDASPGAGFSTTVGGDGGVTIDGVIGHAITDDMKFRATLPPGLPQYPLYGSPNVGAADEMLTFGSSPAAMASKALPNGNRGIALAFPWSAIEERSSSVNTMPFYWGAATIDTGIHYDDFGKSFPLPFTFPFEGNSYTRVNISSNGFLSFQDDGLNIYFPPGAFDAAAPNAVIAPWWRDLISSSQGTIYYESTPEAFTVTYDNVPNYGTSLGQTFQVTLLPTGEFYFSYGHVDAGTNQTQVGFENAAGTDGLLQPSNFAPTDNSSYVYNSTIPDPFRREMLRKMLQYANPPNHVRRSALPRLDLTLTAYGATEMQISTDGVFDDELWVAYSTSAQVIMADGQGTRTVYVRYRDEAGNITVSVSDYTVVDTIAPYPDTPYIPSITNTQVMTLYTPATEATQMAIAEDPNFGGASIQSWAPNATFTLSSALGWHNVYIKYLDAAGNFAVRSNSTYYDNAAPPAPVIATPSAITSTAVQSVALKNDNSRTVENDQGFTYGYGYSFFDYEIKGGPYYYWTAANSIGCSSAGEGYYSPGILSCTLTLPYDGEWPISIRARDAAGNTSPESTITLTLDTVAPAAPTNLRVDNGNGFTNLGWTASASSDVAKYRVYYGPEIGSWTGAFVSEGPSPIDVGGLNYRLNGLSNGVKFYVGIQAIDRAGLVSAPLLTSEVLPNSLTPVEIGSITVPFAVRDLTLSNGFLGVAYPTYVQVYDTSNPKAPAFVWGAGMWDVAKFEIDYPDYFMLDKGINSLFVYQAKDDPGSPVWRGQYVFGSAPYAMSVTSGAVVVAENDTLSYFRRNTDGTLVLAASAGIFGPTRSVSCVPNRCYVGDGSFLDVYDTSGVTPTLANLGYQYLGVGVFASDLKVSGNLVYMAVDSGGLRILDASNVAGPGTIPIIGTLNSQNATAVSVEGPYAYLSDGSANQVVVVDISDPANLSVAGVFATGSNATVDAVIDRNMMYTASSTTLRTAQLGTPTVMQTKDTYISSSSIFNFGRLSMEGTRLAAVRDNTFLLDVHNPSNTTLLQTPGVGASAVLLKDHFLYLANGSNLAVQEVAGATLVARTSLALGAGDIRDIKARGEYLILADTQYGLRSIRATSAPALYLEATCRPTTAACLTSAGAGFGDRVALAGRYGMIFDAGYVYGIDLGYPAAPGLAFSTAAANTTTLCNQGYRVVRGATGVIDMYSLNKATPALDFDRSFSVGVGATPRGCAFTGDDLYLALDNAGLKIFDVSGPGGILKVSYDSWGRLFDVLPTGNLLYLGDYENGLITGQMEP